MATRRLMNRLYYFTIEDEGILADAFAKLEDESFAITYKVAGTDDVFVATGETREAMDRHDVPYNLLAEEEADRIAVYFSPESREELADFEDSLKALALAYRAIGLACVGVNGDRELGLDISKGSESYTYFAAPAGHTFIWRLFFSRAEAEEFLGRFTAEDEEALAWSKALPLESSDELVSYH